MAVKEIDSNEEALFGRNVGFRQLASDITERNNAEKKGMNCFLGISFKDADNKDGVFTADYEYSAVQTHMNPYGEVHGGIISSIADTCMGYTAAAAVDKPVATTDMSVSFYRAHVNRDYDIHIELTHVGFKMVSGICRVTDRKTGELCSMATCSYIVLPITLRRVKV